MMGSIKMIDIRIVTTALILSVLSLPISAFAMLGEDEEDGSDNQDRHFQNRLAVVDKEEDAEESIPTLLPQDVVLNEEFFGEVSRIVAEMDAEEEAKVAAKEARNVERIARYAENDEEIADPLWNFNFRQFAVDEMPPAPNGSIQ